MFKLDVNGVTDVILGKDGTYRIGRVSEIVAPQVDAAWDQKMAEAKVKPEAYRAAIQSEATRAALGDKIIADDSKDGPQKQVQELYIKAPASEPGTGAIKVRHILYSPKDDPPGRQGHPGRPTPPGRRPSSRPRRPTTRSRPTRTCSTSIARKESDETQAQGDDGTGGKLAVLRRRQRRRPGIRRAIMSRASSRATCSRRSSPPSAGT